jgi:hypothetical protein
MMEYTLVFRRAVRSAAQTRPSARPWVAVRPALPVTDGPMEADTAEGEAAEMAQVFVVPICSALGLDGIAYEHFLLESGVVHHALAALGTSSLARPDAVVDARKVIQALVMAAEVQHIVNRISA